MLVNKTEAAKLAGVSKTTIYSHVRSGKLSATNGKIETSELIRVYGALTGKTERAETVQSARNRTAELEAKIAGKDAQIRILEQRIEDKEQSLDDFRHTIRLLEQQKAPPPPPPDRSWVQVTALITALLAIGFIMLGFELAGRT